LISLALRAFDLDRRLGADRLYNLWVKIRSMTVEAFGVAANRRENAALPVVFSFDARRATLQHEA